MRIKIRLAKNVILIIDIIIILVYLYLDKYIKIPDTLVGILIGATFLIISVLGLVTHKVYFTRSEPLSYKRSIIGRIVNILFLLLGIAVIILIL